MDGTPKLQRKHSLSLSLRLNRQRHSASPQHRKSSTINSETNSNEKFTNWESAQRSPSVISICSDGGIECTPPHKKVAVDLDESLEYSPKILDNSFSPTCMLSQTLAIDSPEVGWKWSRHSANSGIENSSIHTPDSAFSEDNSFVSAALNGAEVPGIGCTRGNTYKQGRTKNTRLENKRRVLEKELRRVEQTRADEKLKQRCAKLQEQLKSAGSQNLKTNTQLKEKNSKEFYEIPRTRSLNNVKWDCPSTITRPIKAEVSIQPQQKFKNPELLKDFFNDSDSDCFLLEATQEIESKIETKAQPIFANSTSTTSISSLENTSKSFSNSAPVTTSTPPTVKTEVPIANKNCNTANKEKRSSFYMQFLEDDCSDDWFESLDDIISQATENKKSRTSLQRYNSMPAKTATKSNITLNKKQTAGCKSLSANSKDFMNKLEDATASTSTLSKVKRHSSTHALNPNASKSRGGRQS